MKNKYLLFGVVVLLFLNSFKLIANEFNVNYLMRSEVVRHCFSDFTDISNREQIDQASYRTLLLCAKPANNLKLISIEKDKAVVQWEDTTNEKWEFYVKIPDGTLPSASGGLTSVSTLAITATNGASSAFLIPNTEYEIYIRSSCGGGEVSSWVGPLKFKTLCDYFSVPFSEGFNGDSKDLGCWTIIDGNKDSTSPTGSNIWRTLKSTGSYEGDQSMYISGSKIPEHNDWLITPSISVDASKSYKLKYYYKTNTANRNSFELLLSNSGIDMANFTFVLQHKENVYESGWVEEVVYFGGYSGIVNLAWRVFSRNSATAVYIDAVNIEEVNCPSAFNLNVKDVKQDEVTILWDDSLGKEWEFIVQPRNGKTPSSSDSGILSNSKEAIVKNAFGGSPLTENTKYEFFVRTRCGVNANGDWSGPFYFTTTCDIISLPFWEGFNSDSHTLNCWTVIDVNDDATSSTGNNLWKVNTTSYEGNQSMYFYGLSNLDHDDWLVSPTFRMDKTKYYRLKYKYRTTTTATYTYELEVKLSTDGVKVSDFKQTILPKKNYPNSTIWAEEYIFLTGIEGAVNIGWHMETSGATYFYIDDFSFEEVLGCPEPMTLDVSDIEKDKVTLSWEDGFGASEWEYVVQEENSGHPKIKGITTKLKENVVSSLTSGGSLVPNTDYEFYVRTICGADESSIWQGPYSFATACVSFDLPFWEGFNRDSKSVRCWTILDLGNTAPQPATESSINIWRFYNNNIPTGVYEGDRSMYFNGNTTSASDDWLITPAFNSEGGTIC